MQTAAQRPPTNVARLSHPSITTTRPSVRREVTPPRGSVRKRRNEVSEEISVLAEQKRVLQAQLDSALSHIDGLQAAVDVKDREYLQVRIERDQLLEINRLERDQLLDANQRLQQLVDDLDHRKFCLSYDDIKPGGVLGGAVKEFTFFPDFCSNEAFLDVINFTDGCEPGNGFCENMIRYHHVGLANCRDFQCLKELNTSDAA